MKREDLFDNVERLLFDILQELKTMNSGKKPDIKEENKVVSSGVPCKYCGGTHKNRQVVAACAKKSKKEKEGAK
jgi:hypothetical protein